MSTMTSEIRQFQMHENLLRDVISRQAGTLDKAVLELVMNLIEAGATRGDIHFTPDLLVVKDDGRGFATREEILAAFETFGKSDERAAEEKRWANFQMGRGQAMAFGRTTYRTRTFEMIVDLQTCTDSITYELREGLEDVPGCNVKVELYKHLDDYEMRQIKQSIERAVKYVDVPVLMDDTQLNVAPIFEKWDEVTEDAYYRFTDDDSNRVDVYNLGVYVRSAYIAGAAGIVVSRRQMKLNFARNDAMDDCTVYNEIKGKFGSHVGKSLIKKKTFRPNEVEEVLERLDDGIYSGKQLEKLPLFRDTNGKRWNAKAISRMQNFTFDTSGSRMADRAMQMRHVVVFDINYAKKALRSYDEHDSAEKMRKRIDRIMNITAPTYLEKEKIYDSLPNQDEVIDEKELHGEDKALLRALRTAFDPEHIEKITARHMYRNYEHRQINLGDSASAEAWTDGSSYVIFDRQTLRRNAKSINGWARIMSTMCHEYAHMDESKNHDPDFYERFHDSLESFLKRLQSARSTYAREMKAAGIDCKIEEGDED